MYYHISAGEILELERIIGRERVDGISSDISSDIELGSRCGRTDTDVASRKYSQFVTRYIWNTARESYIIEEFGGAILSKIDT
jgi:hypothetical protein